MRHLEFAEPQLQHAMLLLLENDGTEVTHYQCGRSFRRIQYRKSGEEGDGRMFRLNGRDRETGELVYLPEVS